MLGRLNSACLILVLLGALSWPTPRLAQAQVPVAIGYYAPAPAITYVPEYRGLFGQRLVYRPVVSYPVAGAVAMPASPAPVTAYYPSAAAVPATPAPVTAYYPSAAALAVPASPAPVTAYYPPAAAATVYYPPAAPPTTTYYAPAQVMTYYAPAAPVLAAPPPTTVHYAPRPVITYSVVVP